MIRINLLPPERRRPEPAGLSAWTASFGALAGAAALVALAAGIWVAGSRAQGEIRDRERALAAARAEVAAVRALEVEVAGLRARRDAIRAVERSREVLWSDRLDRLAGILDARAPRVWLTSVRCEESAAGADGPDAWMELGCEATRELEGSAPMGEVTAEFVRSLRAEFLESGADFTRYDDRYPESGMERPGTVEGWSNRFTIRLFRDRAAESR